MPSISVVTATIGRASLAATAESVLSQLAPEDEWIVVADAERKDARGLLWNAAWTAKSNGNARFTWSYSREDGSRFGNCQRDHALSLVRTSHVAFVDDDDVFRPGALALFRQWIAEHPEAVHVGKAEWGTGHHAAGTVLWDQPEFAQGNVATCMVIYPLTPTMPRWMAHNSKGVVSDYGWMQAAAEGREIKFHPEIVATVRP